MKENDEKKNSKLYLRWVLLALASFSTIGGQIANNYPGYLCKK